MRLSSLAYNLLTLFLVQSDLVLIASIINNKIAFKKLNDSNADAELESPQLSELPGYTAGKFTFIKIIILLFLEYRLSC